MKGLGRCPLPTLQTKETARIFCHRNLRLSKDLGTALWIPYAIALSGPPTKGPYVNVTLSYGPPPLAWVYIAHQTFYLIPGYFNGIAYEVQFDVFADNRLTHTHRHEIKLQSIGWIGLLPFVVWVNLFTTHFVEAFEATVYQFVTETISDGVCRTKAFLGQHILPLNRP